MGSSDGEGLSHLYLELVDAYKKISMPQNARVAVLKCFPIWKKMRKSFKKLSELTLKFIPKAWKREAMAHKTPLKDISLKIEILTRLLIFFENLTIWFSCLKTWVDMSRVDAYLWGFFSTSKMRNK